MRRAPGSRFRVSLWLYRLLLLAYPRSFRIRFGPQMVEDFLDLMAGHGSGRPVRDRIETWLWALEDLATSIPRQRIGKNRPIHKGREPDRRGRVGMVFETGVQDIRYALRGWKRSPGFVLTAVLTVALGVGATTTIFSIANSLLLRTPPGVRHPEELVTVTGHENGRFTTLSYPTFRDHRDAHQSLSTMAALEYFPASISTGADAEPEMTAGLLVSANYLSILGTRPAVGRFFLADEDDSASPRPVAVLSHRMWQRRFGSDSSIVGRSVTINRIRFTVIGVTEQGFQGHYWMYDFGIMVPVGMADALVGHDLNSRANTGFVAVARLAPGSSVRRLQEAMKITNDRLRREHPDIYDNDEILVSAYSGMMEEVRGPVKMFLTLLFVVSGIVLTIASANVAGIMLSRAVGRSREMAVRLAVGASRGRLIRLLLTESILLFLAAGVAGTLLVSWATESLTAMRLPIPFPMVFDFTPDAGVLAFSLTITLVTGLLVGLTPALQSTRTDLTTRLKDERAVPGHRTRWRSAFIITQVAGSAVLLIAGGLFVEALRKADSIELGFDPDNVHVLTLDLAIHRYSSEEGKHLFATLLEQSVALPGVESAALAAVLPLGFSRVTTEMTIPGRTPVPGDGTHATDINWVSPDYFGTLGIGMVTGRPIDGGDRTGTHRVLVVNETAAKRFWPGEHAVGKRLLQGTVEYEVIGVARDAKYRSIGDPLRPAVYAALAQTYRATASLIVRPLPGARRIDVQLREIVRGLDPDLPVQTSTRYSELIGLSLLPNRVAAAVAGAFGILGIVLAAVGIFGVVSHTVSQRAREIGIRMALGADVGAIRLPVIVGGLRLTGVGLLIGLPLAFAGARLIRSMLFGLSPADPVTFCAIGLVITAVGLLASYFPARRATRTDPVDALRSE